MIDNKRVIVSIQARLNSTRLPRKVLLPLGGKTVLDWVILRSELSEYIDDIVVATPESDLELKKFCYDRGVVWFGGSEENVMDRVWDAANMVNGDYIVEITADCPLIDPEIISECIKTVAISNIKYSSNIFPRAFPDGFDVQVYSLEELKKEISKKENKNHVGYNIGVKYGNGKNMVFPIEKYIHPEWGLTLDTPEDYVLLYHIFEKFRDKVDFSYVEIMNYLFAHPFLLNINSHIRRKTPEEG